MQAQKFNKAYFIFILIFCILSLGSNYAFASVGIPQDDYLFVPTGYYHVGYQDYQLININKCPNPLYRNTINSKFIQKNTKHCNEIMVRIYYPSFIGGKSQYYSSRYIYEDLINEYPWINKNFVKKIVYLKSYSSYDAPIVNFKFPCVFFSPGFGINAQQYENIIVNLVSYGYIVIAINSQFINGQIYTPDGYATSFINPTSRTDKINLFSNSLDDLEFVYNYMKNNDVWIKKYINWRKVGLLGHSLGAATVANFAIKNKSINAVATLDLTVDLINKENCGYRYSLPFLHMFSSLVHYLNINSKLPFSCERNLNSPYESIVILSNPSNTYDIMYSMHLNFVDFSTLQYFPALRYVLNEIDKRHYKKILGTGDGRLLTKYINENLVEFFNYYLNDIKLTNAFPYYNIINYSM